MKNRYKVEGENGEYLEARLMEGADRKIKIIYKNQRGIQEAIYKNGEEISAKTKMIDGARLLRDPEGNTFLSGYLVAYNKLGPSLREQIPGDWYEVLGRWLALRRV
ncbi:MAG: hypothetical protein WC781_00105 [Candidatus Pacearchaeota archaeon]|jgi:hypothetical protein